MSEHESKNMKIDANDLMDAIIEMGSVIKRTAYLTKDEGSIGCAKLVVFANVP